MRGNNATREKLSISVPKGTCCRTGVKSPLSIGSPSFLLDPHQQTSTLQAMCSSMVMTHASEGKREARAHSPRSRFHVACGNMTGSENSLADFCPKMLPNSPCMAVSEAVPIEHLSILDS
ncbi:hypothetical protein ASPFODRAFT_519912 [Aspergillus luchuensis CBS 106.47]|uniref:Uncharacterized protein n=1 Tax=Aspergillus luchuensis (strain CBS 106.47) TaxID=1137211 RepID=A0A1M3SZE1_ASPLC|nr:hypothetical protein ASPFODRAFT_519912 [Aspergillus luchuensis CBS 106.47]